MLRLTRRCAAANRVTGAFHLKASASSENVALLRNLEMALKTDSEAAQRLSFHLSPSTTRDLSRALDAVKRSTKETVATAESTAVTTAVRPPATEELKMVALQVGLPFIGFGFVDNFIMILAGDYIDLTLGISFGISSMAAAGIGNTISDIAGLGLGNVVEGFCTRLGLPVPALTSEQMMLKRTRLAKIAGSSVGVTIGCLLGMVPLLFLHTRSKDDSPAMSKAADATASQVARAVLQWFESSWQCQKKIPRTEWTVLAGIVLHTHSCPSSVSDAVSTDKFCVLTAATGNKCLGRRDLNTDGLVVNDCHAEVLARRAFLRYLYVEVLSWQKNRQEPHEQSIFERHSTSRRLVLKPQHSLHLFISEAPCGDAAMYELREEVVNHLVQQRTGGSTDNGVINQIELRSELRVTGAKRPRNQDALLPDKRFAQVVGVARVKSGRSDLPLDKQTLSMSCSDKVAKWNALGLQGSLLLQWFEPLVLSSITVSADDEAISVTKQEQALQRAVCTRLEQRGALVEGVRLSCQACVVSDVPHFSRRRTSDRSPSSLALIWMTQELSWTLCEKEKMISKSMEEAKFLEKFFNSFEIEVLMAATGLKQGAKKASKMDQSAMEKVASRLSKRNLLRAFRHVLGQHSLLDTANGLKYLELKQAIPFGDSPAEASSTLSLPVVVIASNDRRKRFFAAFSDWIGVPTTFKQFKL